MKPQQKHLPCSQHQLLLVVSVNCQHWKLVVLTNTHQDSQQHIYNRMKADGKSTVDKRPAVEGGKNASHENTKNEWLNSIFWALP